MNHANSYEEIKPLVELCKAGRLFDAQEWIAAAKPVNLPVEREKKARRKSPLKIAMEKGFHSLVQVLVEGGARIDEEGYSALNHAISERRLDLIELLVENGADIHSVSMDTIFDCWQPEIIEFFISRGADVETGYPLANALIWKIRTALGLFKRYRGRFPSFQEQINIALRHHCYEGNLKWVSLLIWAGADPLARGPKDTGENSDPEEDFNALEWAAFMGHVEIFELKKIVLDPNHPDSPKLLQEACHPENDAILRKLLDRGFNPGELEDGGSSLIDSLVSRMSWNFHFDVWNRWDRKRVDKNFDSSSSRERMKMLHLIIRNGAKWRPSEDDIKSARRSLLKLLPDYTLELIWVLAGYRAARYQDIQQLIKTPSMKALIADHLPRINGLTQDLKGDSPQEEFPL
jgi:hypothetical protein